jgi:hypothetical protein
MAIIYTYPTKATPANDDLILISDSADSNKTKQVTVASIKGQTAGVTSIVAGNNVTISSTGASGTGDVTVNASGGGTFSVQDSGGTAITGIDTLDFNTNLSVSHSLGSSTVTINASGSGPGTGTEDTVPIWSTTSTLGDSLITQNAGATVLNVGTNIASFSTVAGVGSVFTTRVSVNGYSTFGGKLKLSSPDGATFVEIEGPANGGAAYTLKLPSSAPGNNQILQYTTSGNLGWINTPTGSGGISFSGSTANGITTYSNSTTATVSSVFTISSNKLSAPAGTLADPSIEVGAVGGLYAASGGILLAHSGADAIGVSSASIVNYKLTQFNSGLKFGSTGGTLNSYEEGTWTPSAYVPAGSAPTLTTAVGSYIKIGDLVNCYFYLNVTSSSSGNVPMVIASLPFSASNTNGYRGMVSISRNDGTNFYQQQATSGLVSGNQVALKRPDIQATNPSGTTVSITNTETTNASWYAQASLNYILEGTIIFKV